MQCLSGQVECIQVENIMCAASVATSVVANVAVPEAVQIEVE